MKLCKLTPSNMGKVHAQIGPVTPFLQRVMYARCLKRPSYAGITPHRGQFCYPG